jgi:hypothetical protein
MRAADHGSTHDVPFLDRAMAKAHPSTPHFRRLRLYSPERDMSLVPLLPRLMSTLALR